MRPVPPKGILTTTMAKAAPSAGTQYGVSGDIIAPIRPPVTAAVPSRRVGRRRRKAQPSSSHAIAVIIPVSTSKTGRNP